jgi:predicted NUDIX family NTP pyrophosphohydrolase
MFRRAGGTLEALLVHPGGPLWQGKDLGAWSIPKGEPDPGEDLLAAACREFLEETGFAAAPPFLELGSVRQKSGKQVHAWAFEGDCDPALVKSNDFELEWPPRSGRICSFPEIDRAAFFALPEARRRINPAQVPLLDRLEAAARRAD